MLEFRCFWWPLWIRRVLVAFGGLRLEPRRGNAGTIGVTADVDF